MDLVEKVFYGWLVFLAAVLLIALVGQIVLSRRGR